MLWVLGFGGGLLVAQRSVPAGTVEWHLYGGGTFDLPGAATYAGIVQTTNPQNRNEQFQPGRKVQPVIGSSLAVSLGKFFWLYGDYSYIPRDQSEATATLGSSTGVETATRHYWLATGGAQISFPTVQRVSPYLDLGVGVLHHSYTRTSQYTNVIGTPFNQRSISENILTPHVGGGGSGADAEAASQNDPGLIPLCETRQG
jgi:hypothetical protein